MILSKIKYSQFENDEKFWKISEFELGKINLIVGKNSSGKSKTLAVINGLSVILSENVKLPFRYGEYKAYFKNNDLVEYVFYLNFKNGIILEEKLETQAGQETLISREADGIGLIKSKSGNYHEFKIPEDELKTNRRDEIQYPYLDDLNFWAKNVRIFYFGAELGKNSFGLSSKSQKSKAEFDIKLTTRVIDIFNRGKKLHGDKFTSNIIKDFNSIGFNISEIEIGQINTLLIPEFEEETYEILGIRVKEKELDCKTDQSDMSAGMFRALTIIIHFNFYELEKISGTVLIDDIGEGLDFERSDKLIKLLIERVESKKNDIQLIMSTNDRFVMNNVDLKYWQIIDRVGCNVNFYNINNSAKNFEDFKFSGLNNFDFFTSDFFKNGFEDESTL